ncbi:MAG: hypothetical protein WKF70_13445 [Chitinophagaceae bacterium]
MKKLGRCSILDSPKLNAVGKDDHNGRGEGWDFYIRGKGLGVVPWQYG